jgi:Tol biopolymer transport system component
VNDRILFSRIAASGEVRYFVVDADGSDEQPFLPGKEFEGRSVSPDGTRLAIVAVNDQGVLVGGSVGVDGTGFRLLPNAEPRQNLACGVWASDQRIACEGWDDSDASRAGIYTVRASDGGDPQRLTHARDVPCDYSPDGTQLAFVRTGADDAVGTLMVMDARGRDARPLLEDVALAGIACDWSRDGRSILTGSSDGTLMLVTPDGASTPLVGGRVDGYASGGVWSSDGSRILFSMTLEGEQFDVYTTAADGTDLTRITDSELLEEASTWLP